MMKKIKTTPPEEMDVPEIAKGSSRLYPVSFGVDAKQMPEITNWKVGKEYKMVIKVKMTGLRKNERGTSADFEITAYESEKTPEEMDDKEFSEYSGKMLSKNI